MASRNYLGIDLGTSNCAASLAGDSLVDVELYQMTSPGAVGSSALLPSVTYLGTDAEYRDGGFRLPWDGPDASPDFAVGVFARQRGALAPERTVLSAKSWLCNNRVDRTTALLPWGSDIESGKKLSPIEASRRYLEHIRHATRYFLLQRGLGDEIPNAVITVPASFDEVARTLTADAARSADFSSYSLLEEPLAAFYAWLGANDGNSGPSWREQVAVGDIVLVCDVGGGTCDFSLIAVHDDNGSLALERLSVGDHILLGGDNMDLLLAHVLRERLVQSGGTVDRWQFLSLIHSAREAKEALLSRDDLYETSVSVTGRGSSLFATSQSVTINREDITRLIVDGFFPVVAPTDRPEKRRGVALQEIGLAYASEPALTKHLADFLAKSLNNIRLDPRLSQLVPSSALSGDKTHLAPTAVLFNGGVFKARSFRDRIMSVLNNWAPSHDVRALEGSDLDRAVARGAALYGKLSEDPKALRIRARTARSYYLGVQPSMPAIPGFVPPVNGICVVPQGVEEGSALALEGCEFGLVVGEPVDFRFFSSSSRTQDHLGSTVENAPAALDETSHLSVTLPREEGLVHEVVPVRLRSVITDVGALELWMHHTESERAWKVEFNVREPAEGPST